MQICVQSVISSLFSLRAPFRIQPLRYFEARYILSYRRDLWTDLEVDGMIMHMNRIFETAISDLKNFVNCLFVFSQNYTQTIYDSSASESWAHFTDCFCNKVTNAVVPRHFMFLFINMVQLKMDSKASFAPIPLSTFHCLLVDSFI